MQVERQIAIAVTGIGAALLIPEYAGMMRHPPTSPSGLLVAGAVLAAIGTLFGSLLAIDHPARAARVLGVAFWTLVGLAFAGICVLGLTHSATLARRALFGVAGALPLLGPIVVVARSQRADSP